MKYIMDGNSYNSSDNPYSHVMLYGDMRACTYNIGMSPCSLSYRVNFNYCVYMYRRV